MMKRQARQVVQEKCSIPREQLRALFQIFDVEHCGKIDARELKAALRALGVAANASQVKEVLAAIGRSVTDVITFEDFCAIAEAQLPERNSVEAFRQTFELFGGEESGYLTIRHLRRVCEELNEDIPEADLEAMIAEADRDGDGCVTFEDFARIMRQKFDLFDVDSDD